MNEYTPKLPLKVGKYLDYWEYDITDATGDRLALLKDKAHAQSLVDAANHINEAIGLVKRLLKNGLSEGIRGDAEEFLDKIKEARHG